MASIVKKAPLTPAQLTTSAATYYLGLVNNRTKIVKCVVANNDTVTRLVTIYLVPSAGTAGVTNIVTIAQSVAPNETREFYEVEGHYLEGIDFLQAKADAGAVCTIHLTVMEVGM